MLYLVPVHRQTPSSSLGLLDNLLVQLESLRVPLAEAGLGHEALGVGDGGRGDGKPGRGWLPPLVAAEQARSVRQAAPARAGTPATAAATAAQ